MKVLSEKEYRLKLQKIVRMSGARRRCDKLGKLNCRYFATRIVGK